MTASAPQIAFAAIRAVGTMKASRARAKGLAAQATMARLQAKQESLKYKQQAVAVLDNILRTQAAITARAGAGNIDAFTGSAGRLQGLALAQGAQELYTVQDNEIITLRGGEIQAQQYMTTAKAVMQQGKFKAATQMLSPFMQPAMGGPPSPGVAPSYEAGRIIS